MEEITFLREYKARLEAELSETNNRITEIIEEVEELI